MIIQMNHLVVLISQLNGPDANDPRQQQTKQINITSRQINFFPRCICHGRSVQTPNAT